jgi:hypothetical protein
MKILNHLSGETPTSLAIAAEIEKARAEHAAALAKREAALAGLSTMSDAEHIKAEAEYQAQRRAADRAEARVADLEKAHVEASRPSRTLRSEPKPSVRQIALAARSDARALPVDLHYLVELGRTLLVVDLFGRDYAGLRIGVKLHLPAVLGAFPFPLTVVGF